MFDKIDYKAIGRRIEQRRKELGLTLADLAAAVDLSASTIQRYEKGHFDKIKLPVLQAIASALKVAPEWLMCLDAPSASVPPAPREYIRVPVLGRVAAGIPIEAIEDIVGWEDLPSAYGAGGAEYFGLQIKGDSMEPKISDGDVVIVRKQPDVDSGEVAVVLINGCDATVKRIKKNSSGITLIANNPAFEPIYYSNEEVAQLPVVILGRVVELRAKI